MKKILMSGLLISNVCAMDLSSDDCSQNKLIEQDTKRIDERNGEGVAGEKNKYIGEHGWVTRAKKDCAQIAVIRSYWKPTKLLVPYLPQESLYLGSWGGLHIFNIKTGHITCTLNGHTNTVDRACLTDYENLVISGSLDGTIKIWDVGTQKIKSSKDIDKEDGLIQGLVSSGDSFVASYGWGTVDLWDMQLNKLQQSWTTRIFDQDCSYFPQSLMMHNGLICVGLYGGKIVVFDPRSKTAPADQLHEHTGAVSCLIACKQSDISFYSGSFDQAIKQWDFRNLKKSTRTIATCDNINDNDCQITNLYESKDSKKIFATDRKRLMVWDVAGSDAKYWSSCTKGSSRIRDIGMAMDENEAELYITTYDASKPYHYCQELQTISPNYTFDELKALQK